MIPVASTLELPDHPGVFCIGDVVDNAERPRLKKYKKHVAVVVDNLLARLDDKKPTKVYGGSDETISISIGKVRFDETLLVGLAADELLGPQSQVHRRIGRYRALEVGSLLG